MQCDRILVAVHLDWMVGICEQLAVSVAALALFRKRPGDRWISARMRYGTIERKINAAKMTRCTIPCSTVVRPVPNVITLTRRVRANSTPSLALIPKESGLCNRDGSDRRNGESKARQHRA